MTVQTNVPDELVQMAVWTLTLHSPRQSHQAVDVLYVCGHLETLYIYIQHQVQVLLGFVLLISCLIHMKE